jgi:hypothetical protein
VRDERADLTALLDDTTEHPYEPAPAGGPVAAFGRAHP